MIHAYFHSATDKLLLRRSLNELIQAALYRHLPPVEHDGYTSPKGKRFKKTVFSARYRGDTIELMFEALDKNYEAAIAKAILLEDFPIGNVHVTHREIIVKDQKVPHTQNNIIVKSAACVTIRDQMGKLIYLEPRDSRFIQIICNNALEKYETLLGSPYTGELTVKTLWQREKPVTIHYGKAHHICYPARFEIMANHAMLNLMIQTGIGSKIMQGCGWVEVVENKEGGVK